ncbi:MAG: di-heme-cytochrome C peroxidase [Methylococcaceae bacterium]
MGKQKVNQSQPDLSSSGSKMSYLGKALTIATLGLVLLTLAYAAFRFLPDRPVTYGTMEDHFKYGSIGGERVTGIPFWIWQALPLVCADTLQKVAGERLAADYATRVALYETDDGAAAKRRELSREGYKALGFIYEADINGQEKDLPIGISQRQHLGIDRAYINCAVCHTSTVRKNKATPANIILGMPANRFNLYDFEHFIFQCAQHGRASQLPQLDFIPEIQSLGGDLGLLDHYLVYPLAIWIMQDTMHFLQNVAGFSTRQPDWGPGRNDTFTNNKVFLFGYPWQKLMPDWWATGKVDPEGIGIVDWPSIWLQGLRKIRSDGKPMQLHWDGNNDRVEERNLNAALATSALPTAIDHESLECIEQWLETFEPPNYMFEIDQQLAQQGVPIYQQYCADCHGQDGRHFNGEKVGFVTPLPDIGTDPYRLNNYTEDLAVNMATTYAGQPREVSSHPCPGGNSYHYQEPRQNVDNSSVYGRISAMEEEEQSYRYKHYRKTYGYVNMPLDGLWLRAPYLHNGSVPTIRDLLEPQAKRPRKFYRGNDIYDADNLGFQSTETTDAEGKPLFLYDTRVPGNGNLGHEGAQYGTFLSLTEKNALIEYLKTF